MINRLILITLVVIVAKLVTIGIDKEPSPAKLPVVGPSTVPKSLGDFTGQDVPLDDDVKVATGSDFMMNRLFRNKLGDTVNTTVGIWTQYELGIPHAPEECYPGAGWETVSHELKTIPLADGKRAEINQLIFQRGTDRIAVAYWAHMGSEIVHNSEDIRKLRQRLRQTGSKLPPLVKVMLQTDARNLSQADSLLTRFVALLLPSTAAIQ